MVTKVDGQTEPSRVIVLVVDDDADNRNLLAHLVERYVPGGEVLTATNGREAVKVARDAEPDLILLDVCMPEVNGFEACRELKAHAATSSTPILMLSGEMVGTEDRCRALDLGADGYVCKPFHNAELISQARALIRVKQYQDRIRDQQSRLELELERRTHTLRENEAQLRILFEGSPDAIFVEDEDGTVLAANKAAASLHGVAREDLVGMKAIDLVPPEDRKKVLENNRRLLAGHMQHFEGRSLTQSDHLVPVEIRSSRIIYRGRPALLLHVRDITVRRQADERRARTTAALRGAVEAAHELMQCPDIDMLYRRAVELAREKLGIERAAIFLQAGNQVQGTYGTGLDGRTTSEQANRQPMGGFWPIAFQSLPNRDAPCRVIVDRLGEWNGVENTPLDEGWIALTPITSSEKQPAAVFVNDTAISRQALVHDKQDVLAVYCSVLGEIIDRKQAEKRYRDAEHKYRTLVEALPALTYTATLGPTPTTTFISPQVHALMGYTPEEWQADGRMWLRHLHPHDRPRVLKALRSLTCNEQSLDLEYRVLTRTHEVRWIRNHGVCHWDSEDGAPTVHGVLLDITERKQAEQRERELQKELARAKRMESLGMLAGGVAHDLNNILGPLVAYPELIIADLEKDAPIYNDVVEMGRSARRAASVIQDLLSLTRRGRYDLEPLSLNDLARSYVDSVEARTLTAAGSGASIRTVLADDLPLVMGSAPHLTRLVMNLVMNALEAMPDGGTVTIETKSRRTESGDQVVMTVQDQGAGIEAEDLERIFEPFYTKRKMGRGGTGIGLAVVYGIVRDLKGTVDVTSKPGRGTTFTLSFPATEAAAPGLTHSPEVNHGSELVLVVDDVKEQREVASRILRNLGYQVVTAASGREALHYLREHKADLLVLDMIMEEDFDGLDTYREVLQLHPKQRCVIASGFSETARVQEAHRLGAGAYLRKPYSVQTLSRAVRRELDRAA